MPSVQSLTDKGILDVACKHCEFTGEGNYHLRKYTSGWAIVQIVRECFDLAELVAASAVSPSQAQSLTDLVHKSHYAAYCWGFEAGKVGQHVDTTIAGNKAEAALNALLSAIAAGIQSPPAAPVGGEVVVLPDPDPDRDARGYKQFVFPLAVLERGEGGAFRVHANMEALRSIYAMPPGNHPLYAAASVLEAQPQPSEGARVPDNDQPGESQ